MCRPSTGLLRRPPCLPACLDAEGGRTRAGYSLSVGFGLQKDSANVPLRALVSRVFSEVHAMMR